MSVDTEGSEVDILEAFDFDKHVVDVIQVETLGKETDRRERLDALMQKNGFAYVTQVFLQFDTYDRIYRRRRLILTENEPDDANVFDNVKMNGWPVQMSVF